MPKSNFLIKIHKCEMKSTLPAPCARLEVEEGDVVCSEWWALRQTAHQRITVKRQHSSFTLLQPTFMMSGQSKEKVGWQAALFYPEAVRVIGGWSKMFFFFKSLSSWLRAQCRRGPVSCFVSLSSGIVGQRSRGSELNPQDCSKSKW